MSWTPKYLEKQKISRGPREPGEIFVLKWKGLGYFFGRVISDRVALSPSPGSPRDGPWPRERGMYLVYVYAARAAAPLPIPKLSRGNLVIPPVVVTTFPWTAGYFVRVAHRPLVPADVLRRHCFWFAFDEDRLIDEMGNRLRRRSRPCRQQALHNHGSIENEMCEVFGLPLRRD